MIDKSEKLLKSIDNMLSEILKELKRQGRQKESTAVTIDGKQIAEVLAKENAKAAVLYGARPLDSEYL